MSKKIVFSSDAKEALIAGVDQLHKAVSATMGPSGRNVIIEQQMGNPVSTKDGVTVAKAVELEDAIENIGAQLVKQASIKTADQAGDGTTTSTVIACGLASSGISSGEKNNLVEMKKGIDAASKVVVRELRKMSVDITDEEQLRQVATISGNNDSEVGNLIAEAMDKVGRDGVISIEESKTGETYLETVEGMQFDRGYSSPYFVTDNPTMTSILSNPLILILDKKVSQAKELLPILEACSSQNKALLIIAEDIGGEALSTLVVNKMRGILQVVAVKAPGFGDRRTEMLEDIAALTGGTVVSVQKGMKLEKFNSDWLGTSRKVTVGKGTTTIVDGKGNAEDIESRVKDIKTQIEESNSPYEIEVLQDRLGKLIGGVAMIHVGGLSELEMKEKKDRVDDALHATKAALEEGILPGGGAALLKISNKEEIYRKQIEPMLATDSEKLGANILLEVIEHPAKYILHNAGYDKETIEDVVARVGKNKDAFFGYNAKTEEYQNLLDSGIIDPTKVTRLALENAVSVAGTLMITEAVISNPKDENQQQGVDPSQFM